MKTLNSLLLIILICTINSCDKKNKCSNSFINFSNPIISNIKGYNFTSTNNIINTNNSTIYLFTDSAQFYSNFSLSSANENINFNTNSCIYLSEHIKTKKRRYIESIEFILEETSSNFILHGNFCTSKTISNRKSARDIEILFKTEKLINKPIILEFIYD